MAAQGRRPPGDWDRDRAREPDREKDKSRPNDGERERGRERDPVPGPHPPRPGGDRPSSDNLKAGVRHGLGGDRDQEVPVVSLHGDALVDLISGMLPTVTTLPVMHHIRITQELGPLDYMDKLATIVYVVRRPSALVLSPMCCCWSLALVCA